MLGRFLLFGLPLSLTAALAAASCDDGVGVSIGGDPCPVGTVHAEPPDAGPSVAPDGTGHATFAVSRYFFGDTDRDGTLDRLDGWKSFGFDLDGKISAACSTDLCSVRIGANVKNVYPDGELGIDNSFGKLVLPLLLGIRSTFPAAAQASLEDGGPTLLVDIAALGEQADYDSLTSRLYAGAALGKPPAYDGGDAWPVRPELLTDPTHVESAKLTSTTSYLVGDTWVGRFQGELLVEVSFLGYLMQLVVINPVISMQLDPLHQSVTNGTLAGVLATDQLLDETHRLGALYDGTLCGGPTVDSIAAQVAEASDILADGTQDPSKTCNAVSIGLGFNAQRVQLGPIAAPEVTPQAPCGADAGDGGDGG